MDAVKLTVTVNEDRRVVIDLPADMPTGPAEIIVRSLEQPAEQSQSNIPQNPAREAARAKLLAAGFLVMPDNWGFQQGLRPHPRRSANGCRSCSPIQTGQHWT
ncbi:MAG: hypothetical protein IT324_32635 [Anaerolineae bacterium]|nr:hypothetical protein [Anaerolineae bacterium]